MTISENTIPIAYYKSPSPSPSSSSEAIAFSSNRDGNFEIFAMKPGCYWTDQADILLSADNTNPVWPPNGTRIAFVSSNKCTGYSQISYEWRRFGSGKPE
jgi:Tol biopolymer transport system component